MTDWNAMQGVDSTHGKVKARRPQGDVNIKQMSMGSWKANLSKGGAPNAPLRCNNQGSAGTATATKGKP